MKLDELIFLLAVVLQAGALSMGLKMAEHGQHVVVILLLVFALYVVLQSLTVMLAKPDRDNPSGNWFGELIAVVAWLPMISIVYVLLGIWAAKRQPNVFHSSLLQYGLPIALISLFYVALYPASWIANRKASL